MIVLTKQETIMVSGGEMVCYCVPLGESVDDESKYMHDEYLDSCSSAEICKTKCCGWGVKLYEGYVFNGTDTMLYFNVETGEVETKELAGKGYC